MVVNGALFIISSWLLVSAVGVEASCSDGMPESVCICTRFSSDRNSSWGIYHVRCKDGGEIGTLEDLAEVARENNGVLRKLFLSGIDLKSLEPLAGALVEVRRSLVIYNTGVESLEPLGSLQMVGGNFTILGNNALLSMGRLGNLTNVRDRFEIRQNSALVNVSQMDGLRHARFLNINSNSALATIRGFRNVTRFQHLVIRDNANLRHVDAFDNLLIVDNLMIWNNSMLKRIDITGIPVVQGLAWITDNNALRSFRMDSLRFVGGYMGFKSNGNMPSFEAQQGLPYAETGCRTGENMIPNFSYGTYVFKTGLVMLGCKVNKRLPLIVGFGIIGATVIFSMCIFHHMLSQYYSPVGMAMTLEQLRGMFSVHTLALADVLSDLGFIVTVFAVGKVDVWDGNKIEIEFSAMFFIGYISIFVVVLSQIWMMTGTWWGLCRVKLCRAAVLSRNTSEKLPSKSFMQHLMTERRMSWRDWMLLFPGLLVFDAEVVKHLPWGEEVLRSGNKGSKDGFPHSFFAGVAFWSAVIEDVPQIILQILFISVAEGENGWAITGAMASLTVSVADALVRVVFPMLAVYFAGKAPPRPHNCMGNWQKAERGIEADVGVDPGGDEDSTQDSS